MTPLDYELLLQEERQRNKALEQRVSELTASLEKLREEQMQLQMKMQLEAALHAKERQHWQEDRQQRSVVAISASSPAHRPVRIRSMHLKLARPKSVKCTVRPHCSSVRSLQSLPEAMRQHVQQQVQQKQQLYASVIEDQKTSAATEQTARAFQERLHISEPNNAIGFGNQNPVTFPQQFPAVAASEDEHKRKLTQQRLKSYLHTLTCRPPDDDRTIYGLNKPWNCAQLHCATMKKLLVHMHSCTGGMDCAVPLCSSTREVIEHWKSCVNDECAVCRPAKQSLREHSEVLAKTLEALNEGMDVAAAVDEPSSSGKSSFLPGNGAAKRVAFLRLPRTFRRPIESEAESDVGA